MESDVHSVFGLFWIYLILYFGHANCSPNTLFLRFLVWVYLSFIFVIWKEGTRYQQSITNNTQSHFAKQSWRHLKMNFIWFLDNIEFAQFKLGNSKIIVSCNIIITIVLGSPLSYSEQFPLNSGCLLFDCWPPILDWSKLSPKLKSLALWLLFFSKHKKKMWFKCNVTAQFSLSKWLALTYYKIIVGDFNRRQLFPTIKGINALGRKCIIGFAVSRTFEGR